MYRRGKIQHIHFVGIGGIGMSGIAEVLAQPGLPDQRFGCQGDRGDPKARRPWGARSPTATGRRM